MLHSVYIHSKLWQLQLPGMLKIRYPKRPKQHPQNDEPVQPEYLLVRFVWLLVGISPYNDTN